MAEKNPEVCKFFRKPADRFHIRKRRAADSSSDESDPDQPRQPAFKPAKNTLPDNKLVFSSSFCSSSKPKPESEFESEPTKLFFFESSGEIQSHHDSRATAVLETETDFSRDVRERVLKQAEQTLKGEQRSKPGSDKLYKGIHGYTDYKAGFRREQTVAGDKGGGAHGPLRASAHIRTSDRFDYQPDICKDYKETGCCGFGDACKFMHDRGDYKSGWQMEKEWEEKEKARKGAMAMDGAGDSDRENAEEEEDGEDEDALPFACFICRRPLEDPVVTKCMHYFCEHCALKHHSKNKKCFVCNKPTLASSTQHTRSAKRWQKRKSDRKQVLDQCRAASVQCVFYMLKLMKKDLPDLEFTVENEVMVTSQSEIVRKLHPRRTCPYKVLKRVTSINHELDIP